MLIVGTGRSGTNWLLHMLDADPTTHSRNEPLDIPTSPVHDLPAVHLVGDRPEAMDEPWDAFVAWTGARAGERDLRLGAPKQHYRAWAQRSGLVDLASRRRARALLRRLARRYDRHEWEIPAPFLHRSRFDRATVVIKASGMRAEHVEWVLDNRPETRIVHVIRHPGGMLHSYDTRLLRSLQRDQHEAERRLYIGRLQESLASDSAWRPGLRPTDMGVLEALAWNWRYDTEKIIAAGRARSGYQAVVYEDLAADPLGMARKIYAFCGLEASEPVLERIDKSAASNVWGDLAGQPEFVAARWRADATAEIHAIADRVLADSPLQSLF